ncbi:MAG: CotH kinase family protein [Oscillospiraceae bacterium]|jgi:hypothetical protein|nr:CotH kinase family protein [Oscillospiraceae bacterium]
MRRKAIIALVLIFGAASVIFFDNLPFIPKGQTPPDESASANSDGTGEPPANPGETDEPPANAGDGGDSLAVIFSHDAGFYDSDFDITLTCADPEAEIYYTLDGSPPNGDSIKYDGALPVTVRNEVTAATVKAVSIKDGETSRVVTKSYVTGANVSSRFDSGTLVFVLSADPYDLYDYYDGIANEGFLRDEYKKSPDYRGGEIQPTAPANYNKRGKEAERPMYVEFFDSEGKLLGAQAAGARVVGGWSREHSQKSWQLYARWEYGDAGKFKYPFFKTSYSSEGQIISRFDRIRLRNNGNDREFAAVRDELTLQLAREAGFLDTQSAVPAAVFLNGEYYGFSWLKESYCNGYLEQKYGGIKENYQIISNDEKGRDGEDFAVEDYAYLYKLAQDGLTDDAKFEEFCSLVDIDNLMLFYAVQIYIDDRDWPNNNMMMWRYYPDEGEEVTNPYNDGKWRYMMFDVEFSWGLYGSGYRADTLKNVLTGSGNHMGGKSVILSALTERPDMREKFANTICDLISGAFSPENARRVLEELISESDTECMYALDNNTIAPDNPWWPSRDSFADSRKQIRDFAAKRPDVMYKAICGSFGYENSMYEVSVSAPDGAEVCLGTQKLTRGGKLTGKYFDACRVTVKARAYRGYEVSHWTVNGEIFYGESVTVSPENFQGEVIDVTLHLRQSDDELPIYISAVHCAGGDLIELYNPNKTVASTENLYLSDDAENLKRWKIPAMNISPEGSLVIVCKNNNSEEALMKARTNFNVKEGETLYLSDEYGVITGYVNIVNTKKDEELRRQTDGSYEVVKKKGYYEG